MYIVWNLYVKNIMQCRRKALELSDWNWKSMVFIAYWLADFFVMIYFLLDSRDVNYDLIYWVNIEKHEYVWFCTIF